MANRGMKELSSILNGAGPNARRSWSVKMEVLELFAETHGPEIFCNFKKGRKLVVRVEEDKFLRTGTAEDSFVLIGTAKLVQAPRASGVLLLAGLRRFLNEILAKTRQKQLYNDFLQLECTPDGSAVTDIMVKEEREIFARRIHTLEGVLSLLEGVRSDRSGKAQSNGLLCETSSSVDETIEGRVDMWDLVELARNPAQ